MYRENLWYEFIYPVAIKVGTTYSKFFLIFHTSNFPISCFPNFHTSNFPDIFLFPKFPYFQFSCFPNFHTSNFPDIFLFPVFQICILSIFLIFSYFLFSKFSYFQFSWYFPISCFPNFHTSNFPDIFLFSVFQISWYFPISYFPNFHTFNFPDIFLFPVSQIFILSIFPISTFIPTLSHIQIVSLLSCHILPLVSYFILLQFTIFPNFLNKTSFTPTLFPPLYLSTIHFLSAVPVLQSSWRSRHILSVISRPWSHTVFLQFFQFHIVLLFSFLPITVICSTNISWISMEL